MEGGEDVRPNERREALLEKLLQRRQDTIDNLAAEFGVHEQTIRRDIEQLTSSYPLETVRGRYGGGVRVADWYRQDRRNLTPEQMALLDKRASTLQGEKRAVMDSILAQFAPHSRRCR
jgi:DeoR/GlpR family transcriptional regulator of sugar metabolism